MDEIKCLQIIIFDLCIGCLDRWPSGRRRTIGNRVYAQSVPWVRIPLYPPLTSKPSLVEGFDVNSLV